MPPSLLQCQPQPVHKVYMKFKEGSIPVFMDKELVACTTCDPVLLEDLAFGPIRLTTAASSSNSGGGSGPRGGMASGDGHGSRGGVASSRRGGRGARGRGSSQRSQGDHGDDGWGSGPGGGGGGGVLQGASHNSGQATPGYSGGVASMPSGYNRENTSNRSAMTQYHHTPTYNGETIIADIIYILATPPLNIAAMPTFGSGSGHNPITCNCGDEAILLTVRKEDSVNKGVKKVQFLPCMSIDITLQVASSTSVHAQQEVGVTSSCGPINHHWYHPQEVTHQQQQQLIIIIA